jgi:hypothetical protein
MRVMLHDVSDIVSTDPDRFAKRARTGFTIDSMFKCSVAHMMGMQGYLLEHFERGYESNQANRLELSDIIDPVDFNDRELHHLLRLCQKYNQGNFFQLILS